MLEIAPFHIPHIPCLVGPSEPHRIVELLNKPHIVLEGNDVDKLFHLSEVLKSFLYTRAVTFVEETQHEVLLQVCMSNGAPMTTVRRYTTTVAGLVVRRSGRPSRKYLMQLAMVMRIKRVCRPVMRDPILTADKTALTHHRAQYELWSMARTASIVVSHRV